MAASAQALTFSPASQGKSAQKQFTDTLVTQAKNGNIDAAFRLGLALTRGYFGLSVDFSKAREYFKIAMQYNTDLSSKREGANYKLYRAASDGAEKFCYQNRDILGEELTQDKLPDGSVIVKQGSYNMLDYIPTKFLSIECYYAGKIDEKIKQRDAADPSRVERAHKGVAKDMQEAHDAGFVPATGYLGILKCEGYGLEKDVQAGLRLLEAAANAGDGPSKFKLGEIHRIGLYDQKVDLKEAFKWYKAAKEQSIPGVEHGLKRVEKLKHGTCVLL